MNIKLNSDFIRKIVVPQDTLSLIEVTMPKCVYDNAVNTLTEPIDTRVLYGYYENDMLLGCCGYFFDGHKYWVSWTAVLPTHQRKGTGQLLLDKVCYDLRGGDVLKLYVETYEHPMFVKAVTFYWKNDFFLCGYLNNYLDDKYTCLYLEKGL